jgi:hypothetical protein
MLLLKYLGLRNGNQKKQQAAGTTTSWELPVTGMSVTSSILFTSIGTVTIGSH